MMKKLLAIGCIMLFLIAAIPITHIRADYPPEYGPFASAWNHMWDWNSGGFDMLWYSTHPISSYTYTDLQETTSSSLRRIGDGIDNSYVYRAGVPDGYGVWHYWNNYHSTNTWSIPLSDSDDLSGVKRLDLCFDGSGTNSSLISVCIGTSGFEYGNGYTRWHYFNIPAGLSGWHTFWFDDDDYTGRATTQTSSSPGSPDVLISDTTKYLRANPNTAFHPPGSKQILFVKVESGVIQLQGENSGSALRAAWDYYTGPVYDGSTRSFVTYDGEPQWLSNETAPQRLISSPQIPGVPYSTGPNCPAYRVYGWRNEPYYNKTSGLLDRVNRTLQGAASIGSMPSWAKYSNTRVEKRENNTVENTETLYPSSVVSTELSVRGTTNHTEAILNSDSKWVYTTSTIYKYDTFLITKPNPSIDLANTSIQSIKIKLRYNASSYSNIYTKVQFITGGRTIDVYPETSSVYTWPYDYYNIFCWDQLGNPWTWATLNKTQLRLGLRTADGSVEARCNYIGIEVTYNSIIDNSTYNETIISYVTPYGYLNLSALAIDPDLTGPQVYFNVDRLGKTYLKSSPLSDPDFNFMRLWFSKASGVVANLPIHFTSDDIGRYIVRVGSTDWSDYYSSDWYYSATNLQLGNHLSNVSYDITVTDYPPESPIKPAGAAEGDTGIQYTYTAETYDKEGDWIYYKWFWGRDNVNFRVLGPSYIDLLTQQYATKFVMNPTQRLALEHIVDTIFESSAWDGPYPAGLQVVGQHTWHDGTVPKPIFVLVKDDHNDPYWIENTNVSKVSWIDVGHTNAAPDLPSRAQGETQLGINQAYTFFAAASDPQGDKVKIIFDWGDGTTSESNWTGSGNLTSCTHAYTSYDSYVIRLKAQDQFGKESRLQFLSEGLNVTVMGSPNTAPKNIQALPMWHAIKLTWEYPEDDGGFPVTLYEIRCWNDSWWSLIGDPQYADVHNTTAMTWTLSGIQNGENYTFQVRCRSIAGGSPWSANVTGMAGHTPPQWTPNSLTPLTAYSRPTVTLQWLPATFYDGDVLNYYQIWQSQNGVNYSAVQTSTTTSKLMVGLNDTITYYWKLLAYDNSTVNNVSVFSNVVHTTIDNLPPSAPITYNLPSTSKTIHIKVNWSAATDSGSGIAGYEVYYDNSYLLSSPSSKQTTGAGLTTTIDVTGFGDTWYFKVRAVDNVGNDGPWSNVVFTTLQKASGTDYSIIKEVWFNKEYLQINTPMIVQVAIDNRYKPTDVILNIGSDSIGLLPTTSSASNYCYQTSYTPLVSGKDEITITVVNEKDASTVLRIPVDISSVVMTEVRPLVLLLPVDTNIAAIIFSETSLETSAFKDEFGTYHVTYGKNPGKAITLDMTNLEPRFVQGKLWIFNFSYFNSYKLDCDISGTTGLTFYKFDKRAGTTLVLDGFNDWVTKYLGWLLGKDFTLNTETSNDITLSSLSNVVSIKYK